MNAYVVRITHVEDGGFGFGGAFWKGERVREEGEREGGRGRERKGERERER